LLFFTHLPYLTQTRVTRREAPAGGAEEPGRTRSSPGGDRESARSNHWSLWCVRLEGGRHATQSATARHDGRVLFAGGDDDPVGDLVAAYEGTGGRNWVFRAAPTTSVADVSAWPGETHGDPLGRVGRARRLLNLLATSATSPEEEVGLGLGLGLGLAGVYPGGGMRMTWPTEIRLGSVISGLAARMAWTVTPYALAIDDSVSPCLTT
jgi:hypothetical protein